MYPCRFVVKQSSCHNRVKLHTKSARWHSVCSCFTAQTKPKFQEQESRLTVIAFAEKYYNIVNTAMMTDIFHKQTG